MMSPIFPPVSMNIAITRQYRVITAWIVVTVVSKSSTSALIETFIADWSSTITNCAMARATNGSQFIFGAGSTCASRASPAVTLALLVVATSSPVPRRAGVAAHHRRHDARVGHPEPRHAEHAQLGVDDAAHPAGGGLVVDGEGVV